MGYGDIISSSVSKEKAYGTCYGTIPQGEVTLARLATNDEEGNVTSYIAEGEITPDQVKTFGGIGVVEIEDLQDLLSYICNNGFEHHVAISLSQSGDILSEAFENYLGIETYYHNLY